MTSAMSIRDSRHLYTASANRPRCRRRTDQTPLFTIRVRLKSISGQNQASNRGAHCRRQRHLEREKTGVLEVSAPWRRANPRPSLRSLRHANILLSNVFGAADHSQDVFSACSVGTSLKGRRSAMLFQCFWKFASHSSMPDNRRENALEMEVSEVLLPAGNHQECAREASVSIGPFMTNEFGIPSAILV